MVAIPGAFMQADMDEIVHIEMEGEMTELLVIIDAKLYRKFVQVEKGKQVLCVKLKKALYGTLSQGGPPILEKAICRTAGGEF
jgi:hypothetical protein